MSRRFQLDSAIVADIQTVNADSYIDSLKMIDIDLIEPNKNNFYEMSEIEALADDIERQGLMTALVVSEQNGGKYELISGHRRLAALKSLIADGRRRNGKVAAIAKSKGYSVYVHFNELDRNKALGRMINRFLETGRYIKPELITRCGNDINNTYEQAKKATSIVDGFSKWSNLQCSHYLDQRL